MVRSLSLAAILVATAAPALAQRADENVVKAADDAFGTSVGNEKIGLYNAGDVRGFSPTSAGNIRVEGLSVTEHGGFTSRIAAGSTIRVGLTAQGYPFPAPTGIADYALRASADEAILSPILYLGPNRTVAVDIDAQLPIVRDRLSLAAGLAYRYEEAFRGEDSRTFQAGGVLRWRPSDRVELRSFYARSAIMDDLDIGNIFTGGSYLPPRIARRYFGLDWIRTEVRRHFYGSAATVRISDAWQIRAGLFRSENHVLLNPVELYRNVQPDGTGDRTVVTTRDQTAKSTSGDARASFAVTDGVRRHTLHVAVRGRRTERRYGGADVQELGPAVIGRQMAVPEPVFDFGPLSHDEIRQVTAGMGYELRWPGVAELSLGLQKTDYRKTSLVPDRPALITNAGPWLYNGTLALYLTERLVAYGGYTRGLEDSATAPSNALNRNMAPPALRTSQRDAGLRYAILPRLSLVAGLFDVRKPYFNTDPERFYRQLGTVRHRGIELSLAGQPSAGLTVVAGAVFLDADVAGDAVDLGVIGPKPVGTSARTFRANLDYRFPFFDALSLDLGITSLAGEVASPRGPGALGGRQLRTKPRTTIDIGGRFRFRVGDAPVTVRAQITNIFNLYAWDVAPNASFKFIENRRFLLTLAADL
ncbi:TonB-dependent receptor domain-containing protein [Sphingosinicella sp. BN140058]|uniref:TonB-dependent receptor domain-containing protein n=1 Tax=Sphingosinicella sp. BN140058 TaxID=1892855 RepID=UPI0013EC5CF9|nr:TonB-dependent receptor [Sphingosinicella sp. BN140058]